MDSSDSTGASKGNGEVSQYSLPKILAVWAAALPMTLLGWVAAPGLAGPLDSATGIPGTAHFLLLTVGLGSRAYCPLALCSTACSGSTMGADRP